MRKLLAAVLIVAVVGAAVLWMLSAPSPVVAAGSKDLDGGDAGRGRLVFNAGGCASCHQTQGQDDRLKLGGGLALKSPFGTFVAPNISPDPEDGIGRWTTADLVNAMQAGVSPSGRHYYPAFPYTTYAHARVEDIRDLREYLRTLDPVKGKAPSHQLAFPFSLRRGVGLWKLLYLDQAKIADDPGQPPEWNRGRYLVEALGHCAECHTPRDVLGGIRPAERFAGATDLEGQGWVPNITQHPDGIGDWSVKDISYLLARGSTKDGDSVDGAMADVVFNTSELPPADLDAMAIYLKSLPPRQGPEKPKRKD